MSRHVNLLCLALLAMGLSAVAPWCLAQNQTKEATETEKPVAVAAGKATLTAENTTIQFVGTHVGPQPDPRTGHFGKFTGQLTLDPTNQTLQSIQVEIDAASLTTPIDRLTNHLRSPDFFDVRRFPKAAFKSTEIKAPVGDAAYEVTGELTLRGKTQRVTFPAKVQTSADGVLLTSEFTIKRQDFDMNFGPDRVTDEVEITVKVGQPSPKPEAAARRR